MAGLLAAAQALGKRFQARMPAGNPNNPQYPPGGFEIGRGVDAAGDAVDEGDVDPHAGLQRAQLLELLLLLQRRRGQRHEPFQRGAAVGVEADMVIAGAVAMGRRGAGEIERA